MCQVIDEPWEVFETWWGTGKCVDCGRQDRLLYEAMGPEAYDEIAEEAYTLVLNDGVPALRDPSADLIDRPFGDRAPTYIEFCADAGDVNYFIPPTIESTQAACPQCLEARRWLEEWCRSWIFGYYRDDIIEHWAEHEVSHTFTFGRLVVAARNRWRTHKRRLMTPEEVAALVDASLAELRASTGQRAA